MKKFILFFSIAFAMSLLACQDAKDEVKGSVTDLSFYKNVGKLIPTETGMRWLEAYRKANNISSRITSSGYSITRDQLTRLLASVPSLTGVAFTHGLDGDGVHHFLVVPVDQNLELWSGYTDRLIIDANDDAEISHDVALEWATRYRETHPTDIWSHYFGRAIFDDMLTLNDFDILDIEPAINDVDLSPQLLLIVNAGAILSGGRTDGDENVYDASYPNPPGHIY